MKKLSELIPCNYDIDILGIADDSRMVKSGYLFVATKGFNVDHYDYIDDAIVNGAVAIIADRSYKCDSSIPVIVVKNINQIFLELCRSFFDINFNEFKFIGITGTDGKTTTASIVRQILLPDINIAYIGTNGVDVGDDHYDTNNTTPCVFELYKCLAIIRKHNCQNIVMEVSSEALLHNRINGLLFDIIAFTNITEDHLNIHKSAENYRNTKFSLINFLKKDGIIFTNYDDINCQNLTDNRISTFGFSIDSDFTFFDVKHTKNNTIFYIKNNQSDIVDKIISPFFGNYNIYNVGLAYLICLKFGGDSSRLISSIEKLKPVSGRYEKINFGQDFEIILDYAHTLNGISNILDSVRHYRKIITVTGAAGGREKEKRSKIGKLVLEKSDVVIFTMDDPRYESVESIIDDMLSCTNLDNYEKIINRDVAIKRAFDIAQCGDVVLILGKGRDNYMAIEDKKIPYSDYDVIEKYFSK